MSSKTFRLVFCTKWFASGRKDKKLKGLLLQLKTEVLRDDKAATR